MSNVGKWSEVDESSWRDWRSVFNDARGPDLDANCPICLRSGSLHLYYAIDTASERTVNGVRYLGSGARWEWCSACQKYAFLPDGLVPSWWKADFIVEETLNYYPDPNPGPVEEARRRAQRDRG